MVQIDASNETKGLACQPRRFLIVHVTDDPRHIFRVAGDAASLNQPTELLWVSAELLQHTMRRAKAQHLQHEPERSRPVSTSLHS
jgi:hypothetical protein